MFNAAIMESGSSLCLWGLNRKARRIAFQTGRDLKINTTNSTALVEELRKVNYTYLQETSYEVSGLVSSIL